MNLRSIPMTAALVAALPLLAGCGKKSTAAAGPPAGARGPVEVGVVKVEATSIGLSTELPGRVSAYRVAEVRARVSGIVLKRYFEEGANVKEGDVLYQIDPAPYEAAKENARGALAKAQANLEGAQLKETRYKQLIGSNAVSRQDYDDAMVSLHSYEADVVSAQAGLRTAEINLGYTKVAAPVSGRIGASQVTEGAYVQESAATLMAKVQQLDPVYVDVTQSSNELLRFRHQIASGEIRADESGQTPVRLMLDDGTQYRSEGKLQFADVTVGTTTSSVTIRAIFPNPQAELLPGMFVRARLSGATKQNAILVPQQAVTRNHKGDAVAYVIGAEGKAEQRTLETANAIGNQWLVSSGLSAGDQLIVSNLQRISEGTPVQAGETEVSATHLPESSTH